jgi:hypothetical protein
MEDGRVCYIKCEPLRRGIFSFENRSNCHQLRAVEFEAKRAARTAPFERDLPRGIQSPARIRRRGRRKRCAHLGRSHPEANAVLRKGGSRRLELVLHEDERRRTHDREDRGLEQRSHGGTSGSHRGGGGLSWRRRRARELTEEVARRRRGSRAESGRVVVGVGGGCARCQEVWSLRAILRALLSRGGTPTVTLGPHRARGLAPSPILREDSQVRAPRTPPMATEGECFPWAERAVRERRRTREATNA